jgi:hypothetical protein
MTSNVFDDDPVLAAVSELRTQDVDARRAHHLQIRCRAALAAQKRAADTAVSVDAARWTVVAGPALLAGWCAIYVAEIVRFAWTIYRL